MANEMKSVNEVDYNTFLNEVLNGDEVNFIMKIAKITIENKLTKSEMRQMTNIIEMVIKFSPKRSRKL